MSIGFKFNFLTLWVVIAALIYVFCPTQAHASECYIRAGYQTFCATGVHSYGPPNGAIQQPVNHYDNRNVNVSNLPNANAEYGYALVGPRPQPNLQIYNQYDQAPYYSPPLQTPPIYSNHSPAALHFPRMKPELNVGYSYTEIRGTLRLIGGCIYLQPSGAAHSAPLYTVVWPPYTQVRRAGNDIVITENKLGHSYTTLNVPTVFTGGLGHTAFKPDPAIHQHNNINRCQPYPVALVGRWNRY